MASEYALPTSDDFAHNLPVQLTSFIGRDAEMAQVRELIGGSRLVTLTGAGGVGKTRLALQVAASLLAEFPAGAWLVDLAPLTDPALVPVTVARALGLVDAPGRSTMDTVTGLIRNRRALVVLDNCEHLLDGCAALAEELLHACPSLVILATSREPVSVAGEATWLVPSLQLAGEAVELFADRARRTRPGFTVTAENEEAVAEICRRLDGIPLAIELAAARLRAFTPAEIAAGLHDRFRLLTGGSRTAARRQQTLRASVDWSNALLTDPERALFRRLAVFPGGFDLEAAQAVAAGDGLPPDEVLSLLALLVDKSLVTAEESHDVTRYRLPETVRQYAAEKLADSDEAGKVRTRHRDHYTQLAGRLDEPSVSDPRRKIRRLEADIDNLRAAYEWSMELSHIETAIRLASALFPLWLNRSRVRESLPWFEGALADLPVRAPAVAPAVWVRAVADAALLYAWTLPSAIRAWTDRTGAPPIARIEEAVAVARELGEPALLSRALHAACCAAGYLTEAGIRYLDEAEELARQAGDARTLGLILGNEVYRAMVSGDPVAARPAAEEGLVLAGQTADDNTSRQIRAWLGCALFMQGELRRARSLLNGVIAEAEAECLPDWKLNGLAFLGLTLAILGQPDEARAAAEESIAIAHDLSVTPLGYWSLSLAAMASGDREALSGANEAIGRSADLEFVLGCVYYCQSAEADLAARDLPAARLNADKAIAVGTELGQKWGRMQALLTSARVAAAVLDAGRAYDDTYQALIAARGIESQTGIIDALEILGGLARDNEARHKAARLLGAADALRRHIGYQRFQLHQPGYDTASAELRAALGNEPFSQAWDEGAVLTCEEAVSYALRGRGERNRPPIGWLSLTPAEREVARLVAEGLPNKEIADRLFVSPRTVQTHLTHMYNKLGITSRVQLAQQAARHVDAPALPD